MLIKLEFYMDILIPISDYFDRQLKFLRPHLKIFILRIKYVSIFFYGPV